MALELTIQEAVRKPENFLYIFADEAKFLRYIDSKHAKIIRGKKANQNKVLMLSADAYGKKYEDYTAAIRQSFIDNYGMTPAQILVKLAQGETVCGKNWSEGVYGVGAVTNSFAGTSVSVDPTTGKILNNGVEVEGQQAIFNKKGVACFSAVVDGKTYSSNYRSVGKTFCADQVVDSEGNAYNASGKAISSADTSNIWAALIAAGERLLNWLISLFSPESASTELITKENTVPNQGNDGFTTGGTDVQKADLGAIGAAILVTTAIGGAIYSGSKSKKGKK